MTCQGKKGREDLFNIYSKNLSQVIKGQANSFICPICLMNFDRSTLDIDQALTFGHIITEAAGGRKCVLECGKCNHSIGTAYDSHIASEKEDAKWGSGVDGSRKLIKLKIEDKDAAAYGAWEGSQLTFKATDWKDPNYKQLMDRFAAKLCQNRNVEFNMTFSQRYIPEKRNISLIHTAFLMMFHCFGYEYILSKEANIVRNIIRYEKCSWDIGKMITTMNLTPGFTMPAAGVIKQPRRIRAFFVVLPSLINGNSAMAVFLPGFDKAGEKSFQRLLSLRTPKETQIGVKFDAVVSGPFQNGFCRLLWQGTAPLDYNQSVSNNLE